MFIVVYEAGIGNVRSVLRAVEHVTQAGPRRTSRIALSASAEDLRTADYVVVPGQGAFGSFVDGMGEGMGDELRAHVARGRPYLGICLGMQVLFDTSEEAPGKAGLGVFRGHVSRLKPGRDPATGLPLALPHIGWNEVRPTATTSPFGAGASHFYFAHGYAVVADDPALVAATTDYGAPFVSAVAKDNVLGVQFHPEKSQVAGLSLLGDFFRR